MKDVESANLESIQWINVTGLSEVEEIKKIGKVFDIDKLMLEQVLTIFSAIFIPLSFIAGVFGMNFEVLPGVGNPQAFVYFIVGCTVTAVSMVGVFKVLKWF